MINTLRQEILHLTLLKEKWTMLEIWDVIGQGYQFDNIYKELKRLTKEGVFERVQKHNRYYFSIRLKFTDWLTIKNKQQ